MTTPEDEITGYGGQPKTPSSSHSSTGTAPGSPSQGAGGSSQGTQSGQGAQGGQAAPFSQTRSDVHTGSSSTGSQASEPLKEKAHQVADQAKSQGREQFEQFRGTAADQLEKVAQSAKAAASELEHQDSTGLSHYVSDMAQSMVRFADDLRGKSADDLLRDVNTLARNNPALFIAGSIALGFGLTRFAKASGHRSHPGSADTRSMRTGGATSSSTVSSSGLATDHGTSGGYGGGRLPSQAEINRHVDSGASGASVGSVSNAGTLSSSPSSTASASHTTGGAGSTTSRDSKGTDGGLLP
ncbi:hypothetical protein [Stutzerimonas nosocomialis]|uniref:hypothetical protein n=1 Tax=Stutzerimonas nosocomialis TaxID=1056496 RepID=UPI001F4F9C87|nr:hypothetical protein [Stutzerimonas nosocomialis]